jgi:hypothetical protein
MAAWAAENRTEFYKMYNQHRDSDPDAKGGADNPEQHELVIKVPGLTKDGN